MRLTNKYLQVAYELLNERYFGNKLPLPPAPIWVGFAKLKKAYGVTNFSKDTDAVEVLINQDLKKYTSVALLTLLHEMCHVKLGKPQRGHGKAFQVQMLRLAKAGAFKGLW